MAILVNSQTVIFNDRTVKVSSGATRPASPVVGMFWYNTSLGQLEVWNGTAWRPQNIQVGGGTKPQNAYAWGNNTSGRLGDNTITNRLTPVSVVGGFTDWVQIDAGTNHTAAVRANGTAWAWGQNSYGKLGDTTTTDRSSPVSVVGGFTDWVQISAGENHTAAVRGNGTAWAWGVNQFGRLGDGTTTTRSSPVSVVGGFTDWVQISAGFTHTLAVRANGTAWGFGGGGSGQLGNNASGGGGARSSPALVVGGFTDWVQVSAAINFTAAIRANGTIWCFGSNQIGQLGDNTTTSRSSPVSVVGGFTDWVQVSAGGGGHTAAIRANGTAWGWGANGNGQTGDGTAITRLSPVSVVGGFTDWVQISSGQVHTAAVRANGTAWGWGYNGGRLGNNSNTQRSSPVSVFGGFTDWVQISGNIHTAAIRG